ncbi:MAG: hypothetical protein U1E67_04930 [Hyphomicrobiales bacterium]
MSDAAIFDMPMELGLKFMATIGADALDPKRTGSPMEWQEKHRPNTVSPLEPSPAAKAVAR